MTQDERDQLDAICQEAFAKIADMDLRLYQLGFLGKPQNKWGKQTFPSVEAPKKRDIPGGAKVSKPVAPPMLPPTGEANDILAKVAAFANRH